MVPHMLEDINLWSTTLKVGSLRSNQKEIHCLETGQMDFASAYLEDVDLEVYLGWQHGREISKWITKPLNQETNFSSGLNMSILDCGAK